MQTVNVQELNLEQFQPFGVYANFLNPDAEKLGTPPLEFFRDRLQQDLGGVSIASYSTCRVEQRSKVIDVMEFHSRTAEVILPLDNDILVQVAPATADTSVPLDRLCVFRVPLGTMVILRPGVWHHGPFTVNERPANILIALPERAYANDCVVVELSGEDKVAIEV
jgi:ureidoglycolate lyase